MTIDSITDCMYSLLCTELSEGKVVQLPLRQAGQVQTVHLYTVQLYSLARPGQGGASGVQSFSTSPAERSDHSVKSES